MPDVVEPPLPATAPPSTAKSTFPKMPSGAKITVTNPNPEREQPPATYYPAETAESSPSPSDESAVADEVEPKPRREPPREELWIEPAAEPGGAEVFFVAGGVVPFRMGNSHPSLFPYEPLPCADGELIVTAGNDGQFRRLCEVLGLPELVDDPRFLRNEDRTANRDELRPLLVERLRTRPKLEWFRDIIAAGVPCGPINTIDQGLAFAEEVGLDPVVTVGEGAAAVPSVRNPITFSATAPQYRLPPPTLDEHGDELRRWLAAPADEEASA